MASMVLLEHELPSGERHFDWLMERPSDEGGTLLAFRVFARVDEVEIAIGGGAPLPGERMKDHRQVYLEFEGALSGDRGAIRRVSRGRVLELDEGERSIRASVRWDGDLSAAVWSGVLVGGDRWAFQRMG